MDQKRFTIGRYQFDNRTLLAPMAGVTDQPFRQLCRRFGAGLVVSEMVSSNPQLRNSQKTRRRLDHQNEPSPRIVQIAGGDAAIMADAARWNVDRGAEIIDINMGCPAKKVCNKAAGSALLRDIDLVADILTAVVRAVAIPVTLKIRTGWDRDHNNALAIAKLAQDSGVQLLTIHGRSRACHFKGQAEHDTCAQVKANLSIPVVVNGDINTPQQAKRALQHTQADAVMIGRAAQGNPWIFREIQHYLATQQELTPPSPHEVYTTLLEHLNALYGFYGETMGVRIARKHVAWYCQGKPGGIPFRRHFNQLNSGASQQNGLRDYFVNRVFE